MGGEPDTDALPTVLVVDDEKEVADAYALRLRDRYAVETAYGGAAALSTIEESEIDVVLLDRHMPRLSGDDVLAELEGDGYYGRVVMVTAIDPDFDVLDMPFDDYLCKPIEREGLRDAVRQQCTILGYETVGEYFGVESKRVVLEAELPPEERADRPEYGRIEERAARLERRVRRLLDDPDALFDRFDAVEREGR